MASAQGQLWLGSSDTALKQLTKALSKPFKVQKAELPARNWVLLDSIDNALWQQQLVLLANGRSAELHGAGQTLIELTLQQLPPAVPKNLFVSERPAQLAQLSEIRALLPRCELLRQQQQWNLLDDEGKTVARLHIDSFSLEKTSFLLRTRSLRGYNKAHRTLLQIISHCSGLQAASHCLMDPLQALAWQPPPYSNKPTIQIAPAEPARQVAQDLCRTQLGVARINEPWIEQDLDTEFLHDYRVALRKIRSVLSLFKAVFPEADTLRLKQGYASLMQKTNRLRDLDVYLLDREHYFELLPLSLHPGLELMFDDFSLQRRRELQQVVRWLASGEYHEQFSRLAEYFESEISGTSDNAEVPAMQLGCRSIWKRYGKVCRIAQAINGATPDEQVHELRIQCKKLRYLMEFFAPLFPGKRLKQLIKALKGLQDNLGRFNDFSVQQEFLQSYLCQQAQTPQSIQLAEAIGALTLVLSNRQKQERAMVMDSFQRFHSDAVHQSFKQLFQPHAKGSR